AATVDGVWLASAYPKEGLGDSENPGWEESTQMMAHSLKEYSTRWMKYPYPSMTNVAGVVGGMEYPMIIFCAVGDRGESLFGVTDHEFGHIYYPMIVGSDERRHAWMDEGFNTFINFYATLSYYKQDPKSFWQNTAEQITFYSQMRYWDQPLTTAPDLTVPDALGLLAYYKPAYGLVLLREYILGPESFDAAFRAYTERWKYKHPQPQDFFRTIEDVSGEDLAWFWRGWFYSNERYDVGIQNIEVGSGVMTLTLKKNKPLVLPQILEITYQNNTKERIKLPAVIWHMGDTFTKSLPTKGKVLKVQLDPDKLLPDQNRANDAWKSKN
ncbi:MAG TPA: M1 family aminopeptidase, partial [Rhodothermales bacterium]|nr:M1 family aminopeptidase [Rhodothermales bacterium]